MSLRAKTALCCKGVRIWICIDCQEKVVEGREVPFCTSPKSTRALMAKHFALCHVLKHLSLPFWFRLRRTPHRDSATVLPPRLLFIFCSFQRHAVACFVRTLWEHGAFAPKCKLTISYHVPLLRWNKYCAKWLRSFRVKSTSLRIWWQEIGQPVSCWIATTFLYKTGALSARGGEFEDTRLKDPVTKEGPNEWKVPCNRSTLCKADKGSREAVSSWQIGNTQAWASCRGVSTIAVCGPRWSFCSFYCSSYNPFNRQHGAKSR